jgi:hypothetical protein
MGLQKKITASQGKHTMEFNYLAGFTWPGINFISFTSLVFRQDQQKKLTHFLRNYLLVSAHLKVCNLKLRQFIVLGSLKVPFTFECYSTIHNYPRISNRYFVAS